MYSNSQIIRCKYSCIFLFIFIFFASLKNTFAEQNHKIYVKFLSFENSSGIAYDLQVKDGDIIPSLPIFDVPETFVYEDITSFLFIIGIIY